MPEEYFDMNQVAEYFDMQPPTFEDWVSQGPRAKPIPDDSIFSNNYIQEDEEDDNDFNLDEYTLQYEIEA
jgi:hypothetical protein